MTTSIGDAQGYIRLDASSVVQGVSEAKSSLLGFQDYVRSTFSNMGASMQQWGGQVAGAGLALSGLMAPVTALGIDGVKRAMEFEDAMAEIQARSGLTAEEMEAVKAKALEMGAQTNYSAGDASQAMLQLLASGQSVEEMMATLPVVLTAAAASGEELGMTADAVTDIMAQFHLPVEEAVNVVNALSQAAGASSADISSLMQGFGNVGGLASQFGLSVEEVSAILAIFSENGIKGAEAGTQLKSMLTALTTSEDASGALAKLNVSLTDSEGNFRNLNDILGDLRHALYETQTVTVRVNNLTGEQKDTVDRAQKAYARAASQITDYNLGLKGVNLSEEERGKRIAENQQIMANAEAAIASTTGSLGEAQYVTRELNRTEAERFELIKELAGSYGQLGLTALLTTEGGLTPMLDLMNQQADATVVAEARMSTFSGAIESVRGSLETLQINVMTPFMNNTLRPLVDIMTDVLNGMNRWATANPELANTIVMVLAGLSGLGGALVGVGAAMMALGSLIVYSAPAIAAAITLLLGPFGVFLAVFAALYMLVEPFQAIVDTIATSLLGMAGDIAKGMNVFDAFAENFGNLVYIIARMFGMTWREAQAFKANFIEWVGFIRDAWDRLMDGDWGNFAYLLARVFGQSWEQANQFREDVTWFVNVLEFTWQRLLDGNWQLLALQWGMMFGATGDQINGFVNHVQSFVDTVQSLWASLVNGNWGALAAKLTLAFGAPMEQAVSLVSQVAKLTDDIQLFYNQLRFVYALEGMAGIADFLGFTDALEYANAALTRLKGIAQPLIDAVLNPLWNAWKTVSEHSLGAGNALQQVGLFIVGWLFPPLGTLIFLVNLVKTAFETNFLGIQKITSALLSVLQPLWTTGLAGLTQLATTVKTLFATFQSGGSGSVLQVLQDQLMGLADLDVAGAIGGIFSSLGGALENIQAFLAPYIPQFISGFNSLWASLGQNGPAIAQTIGNAIGELLTYALDFAITVLAPAVGALIVGLAGLMIEYGPDLVMGLINLMGWVGTTAIPELIRMAAILGLSFIIGFLQGFNADLILANLLNLLNSAIGFLTPLAQQLLATVMNAINGAVGWLTTEAQGLVSTVLNTLSGLLGDASNTLMMLAGIVLFYLWQASNYIRDQFQAGYDAAVGKLEELKTSVSNTLTGVKDDILSKMLDIALTLAGAWQDAKLAVEGKLTETKAAIEGKFNEVKTAVISKMFEIGLALGAAWNDAKTAVTTILTTLVSDITAKWDEIKNTIITKATELYNAATGMGQDMVDGLQAGIDGAWDAFVAHLQSLYDSLPGILKKIMEIGSPSQVMADLAYWIPEGIKVGIEGNMSAPLDAMREMAELMAAPKQFAPLSELPIVPQPAPVASPNATATAPTETNIYITVTAPQGSDPQDFAAVLGDRLRNLI